jgi:rhodanese-related sulfurtransferase
LSTSVTARRRSSTRPASRPHLAAAEAQGTALRWTIDTHDSIAGALDGGTDAWRAAGGLIAGIPLVTPSEMVATVIDVRQRSEYEAGHVPGSISIELGSLAERPVPDGPVTVMCGHGERAMTGASILTRRGHRDVTVLDGGPDTWAVSNGRPLVVGA